jgi:hypothetical protein
MDIQARRISGSSFSAEDKLEVTFNSDNQLMASVVHTIELVSGSNVTHGGGGQPDEYLHYKAVERDADDNGIIDYSKVFIQVEQTTTGTAVVRVKAQYITQQMTDEHTQEYQDWENEPESDDKSEEGPALTPIELSTGEITLEWSEDSFV